jgi:hypothetical protein
MRVRRRLALFGLPLLAGSALLADSNPKLTADDVVVKHLESLGTPEARSSVTSRIAQGTVRMRIKVSGVGDVNGRAYMFGDPTRFHASLPFDYSDYWGEHFLSDGEKVQVGFSQPSERSPLGEFLRIYQLPLAEGLFGGVLSTRWPLLNVSSRQPRLDYGGVKKIDGTQVHLILYRTRKGRSEVNTQLYFDLETFHHLRSVYTVNVVSAIGRTIESSSQQQERRFSVEEDFSDFRAFSGMTLPTRWRIRCTIDGQLSAEREWDVMFAAITHNAEIDPENFVIGPPKVRGK